MSLKSQNSLKPVPTPVIFPLDSNTPFAPSLSSNASSSSQATERFAYIAELSRKHAAFAKVMQDEPIVALQLGQDFDDEATVERVTALRDRVREAWAKADGNPADSKWIFLTQLLRLRATSGRDGRWIGLRTEIPPSEDLVVPGLDWINAKTEAEWREWEKRYRQERRVKDKVENWKKTVEPPSKGPSLQDSFGSKASNRSTGLPTSKTSGNGLSAPVNPLQSATPFGFSVVKRLSQKNVAGKPAGPEKPRLKADKSKDDSEKASKNTGNKQISDITELSFLPPSFPSSQLVTSTPKPSAKPIAPKPGKPDPIPHIAPPSPPSPSVIPDSDKQQPQSSSPRVTKVYGRHSPSQIQRQSLQASASLPAIPLPSTPTRTSTDKQNKDSSVDETVFNSNNKRVMPSPTTPSNEERAVKKSRTLPQFDPAVSPSTPARRVRATPDQILTTFLRSPKTPTNSKRVPAPVIPPPVVPDASSSSPLSPPPPSSPKKQPVPTLMELLASAKKGKKKLVTAKPRSTAKAQDPLPSEPISEEEKEPEVNENNNVNNPPVNNPPPFLFPTITTLDDSVHANFDIPNHLAEAEKDPFLLDPYDDPIVDMSPSKSLSSLAGSDSEDEVEDPDNSNNFGLSFNPIATSTQRGPFVSNKLSHSDAVDAVAGGSGGDAVNSNDIAAQPNPSQATSKDSWESIYATTSGTGLPRAQPVAPASLNPAYAYNSQFTTGVAKSVYDVDRLLQQDVDLAYSGWIQDPYADEDEGNGVPDSSP